MLVKAILFYRYSASSWSWETSFLLLLWRKPTYTHTDRCAPVWIPLQITHSVKNIWDNLLVIFRIEVLKNLHFCHLVFLTLCYFCFGLCVKIDGSVWFFPIASSQSAPTESKRVFPLQQLMQNEILRCRKDDVQLLLLNSYLLTISRDWFTTAHGHHNHTMTTLDLCLSGKSSLPPFELVICYHCIVGLFVCWAGRYAQKSLE